MGFLREQRGGRVQVPGHHSIQHWGWEEEQARPGEALLRGGREVQLASARRAPHLRWPQSVHLQLRARLRGGHSHGLHDQLQEEVRGQVEPLSSLPWRRVTEKKITTASSLFFFQSCGPLRCKYKESAKNSLI